MFPKTSSPYQPLYSQRLVPHTSNDSNARFLLRSLIVNSRRLLRRLFLDLGRKVARHDTKNANIASTHSTAILLRLLALLQDKRSRLLLHSLLIKFKDAVVRIEEHAIAYRGAQETRVRNNGYDFLRPRVQFLETSLTTGYNGLFGKGIRVLREICRLVRERGVYNGKIVPREFFGDGVDGSSGVTGLVCIFLPVCRGDDCDCCCEISSCRYSRLSYLWCLS